MPPPAVAPSPPPRAAGVFAAEVRQVNDSIRAGARAVYDERYRTFLEIRKRMRPLERRINRGAQ